MTLSLPFSAALIALLTRDHRSAAPSPAEDGPPPNADRLRRDLGLPEAAPPMPLRRGDGDLF